MSSSRSVSWVVTQSIQESEDCVITEITVSTLKTKLREPTIMSLILNEFHVNWTFQVNNSLLTEGHKITLESKLLYFRQLNNCLVHLRFMQSRVSTYLRQKKGIHKILSPSFNPVVIRDLNANIQLPICWTAGR